MSWPGARLLRVRPDVPVGGRRLIVAEPGPTGTVPAEPSPVLTRLVSILTAGLLVLVTAAVAQQLASWHRVVFDRFDRGGLPGHWHRYDGPYGSGVQNCAGAEQAFVRGGLLHLVLQHRDAGECGPGWYSAGLKLDKRFASVDQRISLRFRVASVGGVRGHRIIPMRWPSTGSARSGGEEDYCESSALSGCTTFLHSPYGKISSRYPIDLTRWHTVTFSRRDLTVRAAIDGRRAWVYHGTLATLPPTPKRVVLQQECRSDGCPAGAGGQEVILIDWIKVWNPSG